MFDIMQALMGQQKQEQPQQPQQPQMGPPRPQMGPPAPPPQGPQMPEAYTHNRMQEWGMPKVAQIGEALIDKYRANKWTKENQSEVDEFGGAVGGPQTAVDTAANKPGNSQIGSGIFDGGDMLSKIMKLMG